MIVFLCFLSKSLWEDKKVDRDSKRPHWQPEEELHHHTHIKFPCDVKIHVTQAP